MKLITLFRSIIIILLKNLDYIQTQRDDFSDEKYSVTISQLCSEARATLLEENPGIQFENPNLYKSAHINKQKKRQRKGQVDENNVLSSSYPPSQINQSSTATIISSDNTNENNSISTNSNQTSSFNNNNNNNNNFQLTTTFPATQNYLGFINYDNENTSDGAPPVLATYNSNCYNYNF